MLLAIIEIIRAIFNKNTKTEFEEYMTISDMEKFTKKKYIKLLPPTQMNIVSSVGSVDSKTDSGFKEVLSKAAEAHPNSPLADRFGSGRGGKSRKVENVGKKHGLIRKDGSQNVSKLGSKVSNYK